MAHWRDTFKPARFFFMDAKAGIPILATLLHFRIYTVALTVLWIAIFWVLERRGLSFWAALRGFRAWLIGDLRPARGVFKVRGKIDYERVE